MKVLIIGGGVAGLGVAWRLAEAGAEVELFERGLIGRGATWAAAGMLAPGVESGLDESPFAAFARDAREAWPAFAAELEAASGIDIGYREIGSLVVAPGHARAGALQHEGKELGARAQWLPPEKLIAREPLVSHALKGALYVPGDAQADNRALAEALKVAAKKSGAVLHEGCEAVSLILDGGRLRGLVTSVGAVEATRVVLASGAWLSRIPGAILPRIEPTKGQMIALEPPKGVALPKSLLWSEDVYLVPARRGRLLAGATVEDAGFDTSVTREAVERLHAAAYRIIPSARDWIVAEAWAGLRPRSADGMPLLGETDIEGLFVAGGQFRNGILFAPLVAGIVRDAVLNRTPPNPAFDPKRFKAS